MNTAGVRSIFIGLYSGQGTACTVWSSSVTGLDSYALQFDAISTISDNFVRGSGFSVRCIKD